MVKTTVYLPEATKAAVERLAAALGRSEASLIREAVGALAARAPRPRPRGGLWTSGDPSLSENAESLLQGFGER